MISISLSSGSRPRRARDAQRQAALARIDSGHVERRQLVGALARRGLLKEQRLVLRRVRADFAQCVRAGVLGIISHSRCLVKFDYAFVLRHMKFVCALVMSPDTKQRLGAL